MARPNLDQNPKFKLLVRRLGIAKPYALGLLETMWRVAWENGEPIIGTPEEIEAAAEWPGEPGKYHAALVSGRLLDDVGDGRWAIHDFWDHAPEYVQKRRKRELERQERGTELADNGRLRRTTADGKRKPTPKVRTPAPAPAPAPAPTQKTPPSTATPSFPPGGTATAAISDEPEFPPDDQDDDEEDASEDLPPNPNPEPVPEAEASAYPWNPEDEQRHGQSSHWQEYIEVHMAKRTPPPWPRFLAWLSEDVKKRVPLAIAGEKAIAAAAIPMNPAKPLEPQGDGHAQHQQT